jgi:O-antigen/teichoic acid export membrane protein
LQYKGIFYLWAHQTPTMGEIKKQGIQNAIITYLGILIGFVNLIIIQPYFLDTEEIGLIRVLFSFSSIVAIFIPLGIVNITIKYFPHFRDKDNKHHGYFGFMLLFPVAGFVLVAGALFLFQDFFIGRYSKEAPLFAEFFQWVFPLTLFLGFINVLNIYAYSLFKTSIPSFLNDVLTRVITILVIGAYFLRWLTLEQFIIAYVLIYAFQLLLLATYIFKVDRPGFRVNKEIVKEHGLRNILQFGFLLSFASIASLGLKYLDSLMIADFIGLHDVGIYAIAAFIPTVIEAPLMALDRIAGVKISHALANNRQKEVREIYYKSSKYMMLAGGLLFVGINTNIVSFLSLLPAPFIKGATVVLIISIGTFFSMASGANNSIIFNTEKYKFGAFLLIGLAVIAFVNNLILIPPFGIEGAAAATAISAFFYSAAKYLFIWRHFKLQPYDKHSLIIIILTISATILGFALPDFVNPYISIAYRSILLGTIFCGVVYYLKLAPELNEAMRKALKKIKK